MEEGERDLEGREKLNVSRREIKRYDDRERVCVNCERAISKRARNRKKKRKEGG